MHYNDTLIRVMDVIPSDSQRWALFYFIKTHCPSVNNTVLLRVTHAIHCYGYEGVQSTRATKCWNDFSSLEEFIVNVIPHIEEFCKSEYFTLTANSKPSNVIYGCNEVIKYLKRHNSSLNMEELKLPVFNPSKIVLSPSKRVYRVKKTVNREKIKRISQEIDEFFRNRL